MKKSLHKFMQLANVSDEKEFYKLFPSEEHFFKKFPQARPQETAEFGDVLLGGFRNMQSYDGLSDKKKEIVDEYDTNGYVSALSNANKFVKKVQNQTNAIEAGLRNGLMSIGQLLPETRPDKDVFRASVDNPFAYGTNTQAIYADGGDIVANPIEIQNNGSWFDDKNLPKIKLKNNYTGSFKEAFKNARKELGDNQVFTWKGKQYTTNIQNTPIKSETPKSQIATEDFKSTSNLFNPKFFAKNQEIQISPNQPQITDNMYSPSQLTQLNKQKDLFNKLNKLTKADYMYNTRKNESISDLDKQEKQYSIRQKLQQKLYNLNHASFNPNNTRVNPYIELITSPINSSLNLMRPDKYYENTNSAEDFILNTANLTLDAAATLGTAGELSSITKKIGQASRDAKYILPYKTKSLNIQGKVFFNSDEWYDWYKKTQNNRLLTKKELNFLNKEIQDRGVLEIQRRHPLDIRPYISKKGILPENYNFQEVTKNFFPNLFKGKPFEEITMGPGRADAWNNYLGFPMESKSYKIHPQSFQDGRGLTYTVPDEYVQQKWTDDALQKHPLKEPDLTPLNKQEFAMMDAHRKYSNALNAEKNGEQIDWNSFNKETLSSLKEAGVSTKRLKLDGLLLGRNNFDMRRFDSEMSNYNLSTKNNRIYSGDMYHGSGGGTRWEINPINSSGTNNWTMKDTWDINPFSRFNTVNDLPLPKNVKNIIPDNIQNMNLPSWFKKLNTSSLLGGKDFDVELNYSVSPKYNRIQNLNEYADGGQINDAYDLQIYSGGNAETLGQNPYTGDTILFNGASHADGGIKIDYNGSPVEVQGGEPAFQNKEGDLVILGGMKVPGMNKTFQSLGKQIGKEEASANKILSKAENVAVKKATSRFDIVKNSTSEIMKDAAEKKLQKAAIQKENLAHIQDTILQYAEYAGEKPKKMAEKFAKKGIKISYDDGQSWDNKSKIDLTQEIKPIITPNFEVSPSKLKMASKKETPYINTDLILNEKTHDLMGNVYNIPQFPKDWSRRQIDNYLNQNPIDGISSYNQWNDYMEDGGEIPKAGGGYIVDGKETNKKYYTFINLLKQKNIPFEISSTKRPKGKSFSYHETGNAVDIVPTKGVTMATLHRKIMQDPELLQYMEKNNIGYLNEAPSIGGKKTKNWTGEHLHFGNDPGLQLENNKNFQTFYNQYSGKKFSPKKPISKLNSNTELIPKSENAFRFDLQPKPLESVDNPPTTSQWNKEMLYKFSGLTPTNPSVQQKQINKPSLADKNKLRLWDFMSDIPALFDTPDYVQGQQFNPQPYQPYQVSLQDRLNENNSTFRSQMAQIANNPEALSVLAAEKYKADNAVLAEQFRINQGITNETYNKNVALNNEANLKNLELSDLQYQRQTMAKTNTNNRRQQALADIQNKIAQNDRDNMNIRLYENFSNYRMNNNGEMQNYNNPYYFTDNSTNLTPISKEQYAAQKQKYEMMLEQQRLTQNNNLD